MARTAALLRDGRVEKLVLFQPRVAAGTAAVRLAGQGLRPRDEGATKRGDKDQQTIRRK